MENFTLYRAAKECHTSRPTLLRAIKNRTLKADFDQETGQWNITLPNLLAAGFNPAALTAAPEGPEGPEPKLSHENEALAHELELYKVRLASSEQVVRMQQQLIKVQEKSLEDLRAALKAFSPEVPSPVAKPRNLNSAQFSAKFSAKFPEQIINRARRLICRQCRPPLRRAKSTPQQQLDQPTH